jgi:hypothetical protein
MCTARVLAFCLAMLLLAFPVLADIAPPRQFGQSLAPSKATKVVMDSEEVRITLLPEHARVEAVFHLRNPGETQSFLVGFPEAAPGGRPAVRLLGFSARVDGETVEHTTHSGDEEEKSLGGWITWEMSFPAGESHEVEVSYRVPYRSRYRPTLLGHRDFTYVLKTGAAWHGPIGKAVIDVECGEGLERGHLCDIRLKGHRETGNGVRWELGDLDPEEDVVLSVRRFEGYEVAARHYLEKAKEQATKDALREAGRWHAAAAVCLWRTGDYGRCLASCRAVIEAERLPPKSRGPGRSGGRARIAPLYRAPAEVWERWVVRCLVKLDRVEEARAAAPPAIAALRADLEEKMRYRYRYIEDLEARIARYVAFAAGGVFED